MAKKTFVDWLYTTAPGRMTLKVLLYTGALKPVSYTHLDVYKRQIWYPQPCTLCRAVRFCSLLIWCTGSMRLMSMRQMCIRDSPTIYSSPALPMAAAWPLWKRWTFSPSIVTLRAHPRGQPIHVKFLSSMILCLLNLYRNCAGDVYKRQV